MKKAIGGILTAGGLIGIIFYGYQYFENSESFEAFGADVAISTGDYTPIIISAVVLVAGIVISKMNIK
ncbi:MAG: hypothetical protein CL670_12675 [Balneola sp.]|jgi:hypothetical protein|nr:hypothetical protein [Balneola sp.]MBE80002.1 hypothetical protein [Balneola sp.]HBX64605.1 hypothetical protein [Balneolaceae bacterium]|tara:strand:- start:389 stop:592 length:204 start_codon:yes stop_codon:yes gene_type:complete